MNGGDIVMLIVLMLSVVWTVMTTSLLLSAIGLAVVSAVLAVVMFVMGAKLAAVLELSVCAGLITVIFVSTISLTSVLSKEEERKRVRSRLKRFAPLPFILIALGWFMMKYVNLAVAEVIEPFQIDVKDMLWNMRRVDLVGQIAIILTGMVGIAVLFKNLRSGRERSEK